MVRSLQPTHCNLQSCNTSDLGVYVCAANLISCLPKSFCSIVELGVTLFFDKFADIKRLFACTQAVQQKYVWVLLHATLG